MHVRDQSTRVGGGSSPVDAKPPRVTAVLTRGNAAPIRVNAALTRYTGIMTRGGTAPTPGEIISTQR